MKLFCALLTYTAALIFASSPAFAEPVCPNLNDIKISGFATSFGAPGYYFAYNISPYNTESNWGFIMGPFLVMSQTEAIESANQILNSMISLPIYHDECVYDTGILDLHAVAVKDPIITVNEIKKHLH